MPKKPRIDGGWESKRAIEQLDVAYEALAAHVPGGKNCDNVAITVTGLLPIRSKHIQVLRKAWDSWVDVARRRANSRRIWDEIDDGDALWEKFRRLEREIMPLIGRAGRRLETSIASISEVSRVLAATFRNGGRPRFAAIVAASHEWNGLIGAAKKRKGSTRTPKIIQRQDAAGAIWDQFKNLDPKPSPDQLNAPSSCRKNSIDHAYHWASIHAVRLLRESGAGSHEALKKLLDNRRKRLAEI